MNKARTLILGLGVTGESCVRHLADSDELTVFDTRANPPGIENLRLEHPEVAVLLGYENLDIEEVLARVDRVVVSPGIADDNCLLMAAHQRGLPVLNDIDLFCRAAQAPIYAVTGTNGKSTVTTLVGLMLSVEGAPVGVGGNLGTPALDLLSPDAEGYVLELSSFQLQRLAAYEFAGATILNISEDHLDRHGDMMSYCAAKQRIYAGAKHAVSNRDDELTQPKVKGFATSASFGSDKPQSASDYGIARLSDGTYLMRGDQALLDINELHLPGRHNALNVLAALALCETSGLDPQKMLRAAARFTGLPHRGQLVGKVAGVSFVNDSKATNLGATLAALQGLWSGDEKNLIVLLGGQSKGVDLSPLQPWVAQTCSHAIVFGECADELTNLLQGTAVIRVDSLTAAVTESFAVAAPGQTVLLSPACASFDMFSSFTDRGEQFAGLVHELMQQQSQGWADDI